MLFGSYPQKKPSHKSFTNSILHRVQIPLVIFSTIKPNQYLPFVKEVATIEARISHLSKAKINSRLMELRAQISLHGLNELLMAEVFAIIKQTCIHELGVTLYDNQVIAARVMLDGKLAEMAPGEGKTLAASLCVATAALAGIPVHLITSNDYLAVRDSTALLPLYQALGLTVGAVTQSLNTDQRKQVYANNITYVTAKELVFDYLRDRTVGGIDQSELKQHVTQLTGKSHDRVLRGLCMAVIDEADSILIDDARIPFILSQNMSHEKHQEVYVMAIFLASKLKSGEDFVLDPLQATVELTQDGRQKVELSTQGYGQIWANRLHREEIICQALSALHLYFRNQHYLVQDQTILIIDETTGRAASGRTWSRGLHQLIEIKENCKPSAEMTTATQITYQRFFSRYLHLSGMSGTLHEARAEMFSIYGLRIVKIPPRKANRRIKLPTRIYPSHQALWQAVVERVLSINHRGQPILIGTESVADSEALSEQLQLANLAHEVLNASQNQREAAIIAKAGQFGQITVSTNMAGRGTDIPLGQGVAELGGIHIINCQLNVSKRIDRQMIGRCARQGSPGSVETMLSFDNRLIAQYLPKWIVKFSDKKDCLKLNWLITPILHFTQWLEASRQRTQRRELMKQDAHLEQESLTID